MDTEKKIPTHVSIIMDGNGRWAKGHGDEREEGHKAGVETVREVLTEACHLGIRYLSLYAFSEENWGRPEKEVHALMALMLHCIQSETETMMKNGVRFRVLGNRQRLPDELNSSIDELEATTAGNEQITLIIFLSYSGKWDILQAAKKLAKEMVAKHASEEEIDQVSIPDFNDLLVTAGIPDPDIILRTAGEQRISNYLLWQGAYSELNYTDVMWPDFDKEDFHAVLDEYAHRDRRYGKIK